MTDHIKTRSDHLVYNGDHLVYCVGNVGEWCSYCNTGTTPYQVECTVTARALDTRSLPAGTYTLTQRSGVPCVYDYIFEDGTAITVWLNYPGLGYFTLGWGRYPFDNFSWYYAWRGHFPNANCDSYVDVELTESYRQSGCTGTGNAYLSSV